MSNIIERLRDRERLSLEGVRPLVQACEAAANEITRLRAALAEAERERDGLRARLACRADTDQCVMDEDAPDVPCNDKNCRYVAIVTRAERAEAALAEAREFLTVYTDDGGCPSCGGTCESPKPRCVLEGARAFLKRSACS